MEINFRASLVAQTNVMKLGKHSRKYTPAEVSFVKIDRDSKADIKALKDVKKLWPYSFASNIYKEASNSEYPVDVYALTTQEKDFEYLNPNNIIGLVETSNRYKGSLYLEYLQTDPQYIADEDTDKPLYKQIGTTILNLLKNLKTTEIIQLAPTFSAIDFYEKNDFEIDPMDEGVIVWRKNKKGASK